MGRVPRYPIPTHTGHKLKPTLATMSTTGEETMAVASQHTSPIVFANQSCRSTHSTCWYGKRPHKYCKLQGCIDLGIKRGHITPRSEKKRPREASNTGEEYTLESVDHIYACRCAATNESATVCACDSAACPTF